MAIEGKDAMIKLESNLVLLCIEAATQSRDAVETWQRQRRTIERLPSQLAEALHRRLLYPSLLDIPPELGDCQSLIRMADALLTGKSYVYIKNDGSQECHEAGNLLEFGGIRQEQLDII